MDRIQITDLRIYAYHGVFPEEKEQGQNFYMDCTLYVDLHPAGKSDDLAKTVNYGEVCALLDRKMRKKTFDLIEAAAEYLAKEILLAYPLVKKLELTIRKPEAPIPLPFGEVSVTIERGRHTVYLGLGSNMGEKEVFLRNAIEALDQTPGCRVINVSDFLMTKPYGYENQEDFLNGVLEMTTLFTPQELLGRLHEIEAEAGRERLIHWGPRTLDLDILFYDDLILQESDLTIPHRDLVNREFVLKPLVQIAPYLRHPVGGETVTALLARLSVSENC